MGACARADGINIPPTHNLGPTLQLPLRVEAAHNKEVKLQCKEGGSTKAGGVAPSDGNQEVIPLGPRDGPLSLRCQSRYRSGAARRVSGGTAFNYERYL